jgi:tocopherol O-methyltransferase
MIDRSLAWAGVGQNGESQPRNGVDVGCGIGGSSRHIAKTYGTVMQGITLSPVQVHTHLIFIQIHVVKLSCYVAT